MKITNIKEDDDKVTLTLDGRENLIGTYYKSKLNIDDLKYGDIVYIKGSLRIPSNNTIPHTFNYRKYLEHNHINYLLSIKKIKVIDNSDGLYIVKNSINERIERIDNSGYMKAFILGDKSIIDDENYSNYQSIGITHLFAISGMHIGILSEILLKMLKRLKNGLKYLIIDIFLTSYGFIVCFPSSIKRCLVFYIINSINKVFNLDLNNKQVLFFTIVILIINDPFIIYDTGFLFSICTVGGILLCSDFIKDDNKIKSAIKLSLIAFLFSLPISLYTFYEINILSVIYNLIFVPFISFIVYPLSLITFILPFLNNLLSLCIKVLEWSSTLLSGFKLFNIYMSFNIWELILFYLFLYIIFVKQHKIYICCLFLIIIIDLVIPYMDPNAYVYFLDVSQGDASLLISPHRKEVYLIDTGGLTDTNVSDRYIPLLKYLGIKKIDSIILSHGDSDHAGDVINIVNNFKVSSVIFNADSYDELELDIISELCKRKIPYYSNIRYLNDYMTFYNSNKYDNENDNSNVLLVSLSKYKLLFMGDASYEREKEFLGISNIDVLKVGHHGSRTSSSKEFINSINPRYAVISVGKYNKYGHPNKEVLDILDKSVVYRTDQDGSILFTIGKSMRIKTFNP